MSDFWEKATFASGCYWCGEAVFQRVKGVRDIRTGFTGGEVKNPGYLEVVKGFTNHAEAFQLEFNPETISYETLLKIFFTTHDPTTLNKQDYDVGKHYRSMIFYHNSEQKEIAGSVIENLNRSVFDDNIVTELNPVSAFYEVDESQQNFYNRYYETVGYCKVIIDPKLKKLRDSFSDLLIEEEVSS